MRSQKTNRREFTTPEIAKILRVSTYKVITYVRKGYAAASIQEASGHGSRRLWSYEDLILCAVATVLDKLLTVRGIRHVTDHVKIAMEGGGGETCEVQLRSAITIPISITGFRAVIDKRLAELGW